MGAGESRDTSWDFDVRANVVLVGPRAGKTSLMFRFCGEVPPEGRHKTVGIEFKVVTLSIHKQRVRLVVWDTSSTDDPHRVVTRTYLQRTANAVMLVYDTTDRSTFEAVPEWLAYIRRHTHEKTPILLVGTKCELERERVVKTHEGRTLAQREGLAGFMETSTKANIHVQESFRLLAALARSRVEALARQEIASNSCTKTHEAFDDDKSKSLSPKITGAGELGNTTPRERSMCPCLCGDERRRKRAAEGAR